MHYTIFSAELFAHSCVATTSTQKKRKTIDWPDSAVPLLLQCLVKNYSHPRNPLINHMPWCWKEPICQHKTQSALPAKMQNANMANYAILCCSVKDGALTMALKHILMALKFTVLFCQDFVDTCAYWQNSQKSPGINTCPIGGGGYMLKGFYEEAAGSCLRIIITVAHGAPFI